MYEHSRRILIWFGLFRPMAIIWQWMWCAFLQGLPDFITHHLLLPSQPCIPKPKDFYTVLLQITITLPVFLHLIRKAMLRTIEFDVQPGFQAEEIQYNWAVWMLPPKFVLGKTAVTQPAPEQFFRPSVVLPQITG